MSKCVGLVPGGNLTPAQQARLKSELAQVSKVCRICKCWKPLDKFSFDKRAVVHRARCSDCINKIVRTRRAERTCPLTKNIWKEGRLRYHAGKRVMIRIAIEKGGLTYKQLCKHFDIPEASLRTLLVRWNFPRPRRRPQMPQRMTPTETLAEIHRLISRGLTYKSIGVHVGRPRGSIASHVHNYMLRDLPYPLPEGQDYVTWKRLGLTGPRPASGGVPSMPGRSPSAISDDDHGAIQEETRNADAA